MSAEEDLLKLEAFARFKVDTKLADMVMELGVPYPKLLKWRKEFRAAEVDGSIMELIDVDAVIVHEVAEQVKRKLQGLTEDEESLRAIEGEIMTSMEGIDGYQMLNVKVQAAAVKLASRIDALSFSTHDAKDLGLLVDALCKIQVAFFNKTGTFVQINNPGETTSPLGEFKGLLGN
jgi:hypothetical protein